MDNTNFFNDAIPPVNHLWPDPLFQFKSKGSENRDDIYKAVGSLCSTWEIVEITMGSIFSVLVESESIAAQRAYGIIANTNGKKAAIEQAAEIFLDRHPSFPNADFKMLMNHYQKAAEYRAKVAHGMVVTFTDTNNFLVPSFFASKFREAKTKDFADKIKNSTDEFSIHGNKFRYTHEDIRFIESKLNILIGCLGGFVLKVMAIELLAKQPKVVAQN